MVFLALLLAVVTVFPYGLLAFGFGTILLTFFQDFFLALVPLAKKGPSLQGTEALAPEFFELL